MDAVTLIRLALAVISDRLITILALLASSVMCGWTMWNPMWERVTTLAIFVVFSYLVVNIKEKNNERSEKTELS
jgi:small-conductance mechanosensitive channel